MNEIDSAIRELFPVFIGKFEAFYIIVDLFVIWFMIHFILSLLDEFLELGRG